MTLKKRVELFQRLKAHNPAPTTELKYRSPFQLLIAVILSAQATDKSVNLATRELFKVAGTPKKMLAVKESGLRKYIKTIGLFNTKAKNIIKTCAILLQEHHGKVPDTREALEALPGVGRKTANVILNTAFGQPTIAVDTHIFRVSNRTGQERARGRAKTAQKRPPGIYARRPSLVDPAWPLYLYRTQTPLRRLCDRRPVRVPRQAPRLSCAVLIDIYSIVIAGKYACHHETP